MWRDVTEICNNLNQLILKRCEPTRCQIRAMQFWKSKRRKRKDRISLLEPLSQETGKLLKAYDDMIFFFSFLVFSCVRYLRVLINEPYLKVYVVYWFSYYNIWFLFFYIHLLYFELNCYIHFIQLSNYNYDLYEF